MYHTDCLKDYGSSWKGAWQQEKTWHMLNKGVSTFSSTQLIVTFDCLMEGKTIEGFQGHWGKEPSEDMN